MKLASWNVNSLKVRLAQVMDWFQETQVDVLALQETKLTDADFPVDVFHAQGLHVAFSGQKTYNGVALISRTRIDDVLLDMPGSDDPQRRLIAGTINGVRVVNLYVPNGAAVDSDKYQYKLTWLKQVNALIAQQYQHHPKLAVVGDFNIAPEDQDVHDPAEWQGSILVSEPERAAFLNLLSLGLHDSFRLFPQEPQTFSWWDYRAAGFRRNRGMRIDHILLSDVLKTRCTQSVIDTNPRKSERPSDHAPVWVELLE